MESSSSQNQADSLGGYTSWAAWVEGFAVMKFVILPWWTKLKEKFILSVSQIQSREPSKHMTVI